MNVIWYIVVVLITKGEEGKPFIGTPAWETQRRGGEEANCKGRISMDEGVRGGARGID